MTEEEAKTKWCHRAGRDTQFFRLKPDGTLDVPPWDRCVASNCVAWCWVRESEYDKWEQGEAFERQGYCGLAGGTNA